MRTDSTVIFVHIPKTAGTTLRRIIWRFYKRQEIYSIDGRAGAVDEFKRLDLATRERIRLLVGHMDFGLHPWIPRPYLYITMLREPIDYVMSHYYYARREPRHQNHAAIHAQNMSLVDYIHSGLEVMTGNGQTRILSGRWTALGHAPCPPEALEEAKHNLRTYFGVIGLTERFDESLLLLKPTTGWDQLFYVRQNETPDRPEAADLPPAAVQALHEANTLDIELYRYATELFDQQVQSRGAAFVRELSEFQARNRRYERWHKISYALDPRYSVRAVLNTIRYKFLRSSA